ncbi:MAG: hypothetical protein J6J52_02075 [Oscillospiraceae bacterium]|nr:hypothetical protein [Oscillospiraceae bacterium]
MKNNNYIGKINTLGKIGRILLIFLRIACVMGIVCFVVAAVGINTIPKDDVITSKGTISYETVIDNNRLPDHVSSGLEDTENSEETIDFLETILSVKENLITDNGIEYYTFNMSFDAPNTRAMILSYTIAMICGALFLGLTLIVVIFGGKLASALEKCSSPFEESVTKSMKHFAFSLIPIATVYCVIGQQASLSMIVIVLAMIAIAYIFSYGAELQKESDETL